MRICVCGGGGAHRRGNLLFNYAFNIQDDVWLITTNVRTQNNYVKTITSRLCCMAYGHSCEVTCLSEPTSHFNEIGHLLHYLTMSLRIESHALEECPYIMPAIKKTQP